MEREEKADDHEKETDDSSKKSEDKVGLSGTACNLLTHSLS